MYTKSVNYIFPLRNILLHFHLFCNILLFGFVYLILYLFLSSIFVHSVLLTILFVCVSLRYAYVVRANLD